MKALIIALMILPAIAAEKADPKPPTPKAEARSKLTDAEAKYVRELQLAISQAAYAQLEARTKLDAFVQAKQSAICNGGRLQDDLTCSAPPKEEKKEGK